ncbi:MAG TPA: PrsW family intramembrane metalloprotease [bacterium]|nr:PrsW family intramembrane metalloprotease [bacterium]
MEYLLGAAAVTVATAASVALIWFLDRFEKDPLWLLTLVFLWGAVPAIVAAGTLNTVFGLSLNVVFGPFLGNALTASFVAPPVEETAKGLALLLVFLVLRHRFTDVLAGIVFGAVVGAGFAWVEDITYIWQALAQGGMEAMTAVFVLRVFAFGFNHAFFTALTGLGFGLARELRSCWLGAAAVLFFFALAIAAHFLHNFLASFFDVSGAVVAFLVHWAGVGALLVVVVAAWVYQWKWIKVELREEVTRGNVGERDYRQVSKWFGRLGWELKFLAAFDFAGFFRVRKMFNQLVRLAFLKRDYRRRPDEATKRRIDETRARVALLRRKFA